MQVLEINNNKITNIYDVDDFEKLKQITDNELLQVDGPCVVGEDIKFYDIVDNKLQRKSLQTLIEEKLVVLQNDEKVENGQIVKKTKKELYEEGRLHLAPTEKIAEDGETIVLKTPLELFHEDIITEEEFFLHAQNITRLLYKKIFRTTDDEIIMREKRQFLGIWEEKDEIEFQNRMQEYKKAVDEYRQVKQEMLNMRGNKQRIVEYYSKELIPRLRELHNNVNMLFE